MKLSINKFDSINTWWDIYAKKTNKNIFQCNWQARKSNETRITVLFRIQTEQNV